MKSSLLGVLMFSAVLWPVETFAQTAPDAMAKAVKADSMKWEPLGDSAFEISILYINPTTQARAACGPIRFVVQPQSRRAMGQAAEMEIRTPRITELQRPLSVAPD